ncbi:tRNA pseudouridine(38-40) synthase TruA [bacterium]|nr:tRNA pseudouridine(38-40) synthase TruA [bacterium]
MRNIKIIIEYDGTNFNGWQFQPHHRSVQGELQRAVKQITGEQVSIEGAGRTDTGVHARGQVGNFKIEKEIGLPELMKGLNAVLPDDVRVKSIDEVDMNFHSRFSAKERRYKYYMVQHPISIGRQYYWYYPHELDFEIMKSACCLLIGQKNFRSFCLSRAEVSHYICEVRKAEWYEKDGAMIFEINANRFLHNMVRTIVGTFVNLGRGRITYDDLLSIMEKEDRRVAGFSAPAEGLCLEEVVY